MANNNNLLYNAALAGFIAGAYGGTYPTSITTGQIAPTLAAAQAWAKEVDSLIANDSTISGATGATLLPTTAAITAAQAGKVGLVQSLSYAFSAGRNSTDAVSTDYAGAAASLALVYTQAAAQQADA